MGQQSPAIKIAIYGKGGIGKSTICANLSAALAGMGKKVLQIGCDPKHDSTRLLLGGRRIVTALDYMKETPPPLQRLDKVLHKGFGGVVCAEAGGPEPGVGCAGRGILSTFALFERLGLDMDAFDVVVYDVLGDVVCGGFAVPLRRGFADRVYVVTSEEFMSVYAANNILKGVKNFDQEGLGLAGLILNSRGEDEGRNPLKRFAGQVGVPLKQIIPRSRLFRQAEMKEKTVVEAFGDSREAWIFQELARDVLENRTVYPARFLDETVLENLVCPDKAPGIPPFNIIKEKTIDPEPAGQSGDPRDQQGSGRPPMFLSKSLISREPLHGCAFSGALSTTTQITDAVTVAHGPASCTHIACQAVLSAGLRLEAQKKIRLAHQLAPAVVSSDMDESVVIYGGKQNLIETVEQALNRPVENTASNRPGAVFLLTTCPSGVIGDDPKAAITDIHKRHPHVPVIPIATDGNMQGDYMQGVINACMEGAAALVDETVTPEDRCVNILAEKNIAYNAESNFAAMAGLLKSMGIGVNCRFVRNTTVAQLKHFKKAPLNLAAYNDYLGRLMADFAKSRLGVPTADLPFPVGFTETVAWILQVADFFNCRDKGQALIDSHKRTYDQMIRAYSKQLKGRRLMILTYIHNVDWIVEAAGDLGMTVVKVGILNYSQDNRFITRYPGQFDVELDYDPAKRDPDLLRLKPDLLLGNYTPRNLPFDLHVDIIPMCPDTGFYSGLAFARRWAGLLCAPVTEGWKNDGI